jgi:hypothetical protein
VLSEKLKIEEKKFYKKPRKLEPTNNESGICPRTNIIVVLRKLIVEDKVTNYN